MAAIEEACRSVLHLNAWALSEPVLALAERLTDTLPAPLDRALFLSTGGEGIEAALRMAKLASGGFEVASLTRSWHGLTAGAAALTLAGGAAPRLRADAAGRPRAAGAVRLPLPGPPLRRRLRLHLPGDRLRPDRPGGVGAPAAVVAEPVLSAGG